MRFLLLASAASVVALFVGPATAQSPAAGTPEQARAFVEAAEKDLTDFSMVSSRAAWVNETYVNDDSDAVAAYFGAIGTEKGVRYAKEAARWAQIQGLDADTQPQARYAAWFADARGTGNSGCGDRAQHDRDAATIDLRQGTGHARWQVPAWRRGRGADGLHPRPGEARRAVAELARDDRATDARRLSPHGRNLERRREGAWLRRHRSDVALALRHEPAGIRGRCTTACFPS